VRHIEFLPDDGTALASLWLKGPDPEEPSMTIKKERIALDHTG
jgi:hypothetical protein